MFNPFKGLFNKVPQDTSADTPDPPTGEIAVTESSLFKNLDFGEFNPDELARRKGGLRIYDKMRIDDQIKGSLYIKKYAALASGWRIDPASDDPKDKEIAEFVNDTLLNIKGTVNGVLLDTLTALDFGYSISEIIWKQIESGDHEGKIRIDRIKPKKPHWYQFSSDEFGNLRPNGLIQTFLLPISSSNKDRHLPVDKFVIYSYMEEFSNHYGRSDLRSAYRSWWHKENILKFWAIYLERFGSPLAIGKYKTNDPAIKTQLQTMLSNLQNKTSIAYRDGDFDIDFLESMKKAVADYDKSLQYHDRAISRSILIPDRLSASGETGAFSQANVHFKVFLWVVGQLQNELAEDVMEEQIIRRLVAWNFADVTKLPKFRFNEHTEEQKLELVEAFASAVQKGAIQPSFQDENHLRETLKMPERGEEEADTRPKQDKKPTDGVDEDDAEPSKAMKKKYAAREKTSYEKKTNFKQVEKELDTIEAKSLEESRRILTKQRDDFTSVVFRKQFKNELTTGFVNSIVLKFWPELKRGFQKMFEVTDEQGQKDGKKELPKKFVKGKTGVPIAPDKAISYFDSKADFVVAGVRDPLTLSLKAVLLNAIRNGEAANKTKEKLEKAYAPYLAEGDILVDQKQIKGFRLETLVRTNMSEAYNFGRRAVGDELGDFIIGYQFSEILDDRTAEISRFVDGKIIPANHPDLGTLTYPLHFNDRGVFVYVTSDEKPVNFMSDAEIAQAVSMKGI